MKIRPFAALMGTLQASLWAGAGVNFEINFGRPLVLTLGFGPGFFFAGHGKNLGYPLEMRSSIELAYRFRSQSRLGLQFYHLSNGSMSQRNPGTEALVLFYAIPI
ncbi:MAG: acyloxyacyl hydrolase [Chlamydiae bacterium]|nr:acyloxyacyl hydrolase [Chlamydiota bacterium]